MADLATGSSGYSSGSIDTWPAAVNNVTLHRAEHVNGFASAIIQIETVLGSGATLPGSHATLAARLAVQVGADGIIIPPGAAMPFFGSSSPTGWLFCDGSAVSRTTYSALFTAIGTQHGSGDGSTTFNLPDCRGRGLVGAGTGARNGESGTGVISGGTALTARSLGQWFGEEEHEQTEAELLPHSHFVAGGQAGSGGFVSVLSDNSAPSSITSGTTGGGEPFNVMQPSLVCNWIIKT